MADPIGVAFLDFRAQTAEFVKQLDAAGDAAIRSSNAFIQSGQEVTNAQRNAFRSQERVNDAIFSLRATAEQRELRNLDRKHRQMIALAKKYGVDVTGLEAEIEKSKLAVQEKFAREREQKAAADAQRRVQAQKQADDMVFAATATAKQKALRDFDERNQQILNSLKAAGANTVALERQIAKDRRAVQIQHTEMEAKQVRSASRLSKESLGLADAIRRVGVEMLGAQGAGESLNAMLSDMGLRIPGLSAVLQKYIVEVGKGEGAHAAFARGLGKGVVALGAAVTLARSAADMMKTLALQNLSSADAWSQHQVEMKKADLELKVLNGSLTEHQAKLQGVDAEMTALTNQQERWAEARRNFEREGGGWNQNKKALLFGLTENQFSERVEQLGREIEMLRKRKEVIAATPAGLERKKQIEAEAEAQRVWNERLIEGNNERIRDINEAHRRIVSGQEMVAGLLMETRVTSALAQAKGEDARFTIQQIVRKHELVKSLEALIPFEERTGLAYEGTLRTIQAVIDAEKRIHDAAQAKEKAEEIIKIERELQAMLIELTGTAAEKAAFYFDQRWEGILKRAKEFGVALSEAQNEALDKGRADAIKKAQEETDARTEGQDKATKAVKESAEAVHNLTTVINDSGKVAEAAAAKMYRYGSAVSVNAGKGFAGALNIDPSLLMRSSVRAAGGLGLPQGYGGGAMAPTVIVNNQTPAGVSAEWRDSQLVLVVSENVRRDGAVSQALTGTYGGSRKVNPR